MAVRFAVDGDAYTSTAMPGSTFTVTCWAYLTTDRGHYQPFWGIFNGTGTYRYLTTDSDGTTLKFFAQGTIVPTGPNMSLATWYRTAVVVTGSGTGAVTLYYGTAGSGLTTVTGDVAVGATNSFYIGGSTFTNEFLNGRVGAFKMWTAALTQAEVETELAQYSPVRTANLFRFHPFVSASLTDYSGNANTLTAGSPAATTEDGPPIRWGRRSGTGVSFTPHMPTVDAGKDVFGTANFEFSIQAVETGIGITDRSWTVVSGPAEVATEIGTTSLLSWFPATPGVYELEYRVTNSAGEAYDTVYATVNATGTIVNSASASGTGTTLTCNKPTSTAEGDVMLAVQSGDFNDLDLMTSPLPWQPLFEYDVGFDSLHIKGWTLTAGAAEPASYDFTQGTGSAGVVTIVSMRGVVEGGVRREIVADTGTTATRPSPTVEGAVDGSILLCGAMTAPGAARTWTPPSGMIEQADVQSGTATTHSVASLLDPGDPTGVKNFTLSGTTVAPGGIQWSAVFPMPPDPQRRGDNKSMFTVVKTR